MSDKNHRLDRPNDAVDKPGLLFDSGATLHGVSTESGHPKELAQEPLTSDIPPMSPSGHGVIYSHHPAASSLGVPRWNSNEMNQWPYRLFTTAPPTPSGGSTLPLGSFRMPPKQQDLEDAQNPSLPPPSEHMPPFLGQLSQTNLQIYNNCRGNRPNLWPVIAEEIYNLQEKYGELIIFVPGTEAEPKYVCGVCAHPTTTDKRHTTPKRRWDSSPDIMSHGPRAIKPWLSNCGRCFPRDRDQRRHSDSCPKCNPAQEPPSTSSPVPSSVASSPSCGPRVPLPAIPLHDTTPREPVVPRSPVMNRRLHRECQSHLPDNVFVARDPKPVQAMPFDTLPLYYSDVYGPWASRQYGGMHINRLYSPLANCGNGHMCPSRGAGGHHIDFANGGWGPDVYNPYPLPALLPPGHPNGPRFMGFPPPMPVLGEGATLGANPPSIPPPSTPRYGASGERQDFWKQDGHNSTYGDKVRTSVIVSEKPVGEALEWRGKRVELSHRFTAALLSLLILSVLFWFLVRYFLYP